MENFLELIIAVLGGGGLTALACLPFARKKARAEADTSVVDNYEKYIERTDRRIEKLEEKVERLERENARRASAMSAGYCCPFLQGASPYDCPIIHKYDEVQNADD